MGNMQVFRLEKFKMKDVGNIQKERDRELEEYNDFVDKEASKHNVILMQSENFQNDIENTLNNAGVEAGDKSIVMLGAVVSASRSFWEKHYDADNHVLDNVGLQYFKDSLEYIENGNLGKVIDARIDVDQGSPHMQVYMVPLVRVPTMENYYVEAEQGSSGKLQEKKDGRVFEKPYPDEMKDIPHIQKRRQAVDEQGNRLYHTGLAGSKVLSGRALSNRQTDFNKRVGKRYGLERGEIRYGTPEVREHREALAYHVETLQNSVQTLQNDVLELKREKDTLMKQTRKLRLLKHSSESLRKSASDAVYDAMRKEREELPAAKEVAEVAKQLNEERNKKTARRLPSGSVVYENPDGVKESDFYLGS